MGKTSSEVKTRWMKANYASYRVNLRKDTDSELIAYIERRKHNGEQTTEIFREAVRRLKNEGWPKPSKT